VAAARPRTLFAAVCPVLLGGAIAGWQAPLWLALILLCALLIQIGTNFANDYWDWKKGADRPGRKGPQRMTGNLAPRAMLFATCGIFACAAMVGAVLVLRGGWPILLIGSVSLACGFLYTAGPFPLAYLGLGELFTFVFFGPVASSGTTYLLVGEWSVASAVAGLAPGAYSVALIEVNNLRDREEDVAVGKRTLAVRFGRRAGMLIFTLAAVLPVPASIALLDGPGMPGVVAAGLVAALLGVRLVRAAHRAVLDGRWNPLLGMAACSSMAYTTVCVLLWTIR
jgi:1,4-dihydroxy-2-naphthoate octaprenyltransferase